VSNPSPERPQAISVDEIETQIDSQQTEIEILETHIALKDASVASEVEVKTLQAAQQKHRDNIHDLERSKDDLTGTSSPIPE
jgi:hypothetical protein